MAALVFVSWWGGGNMTPVLALGAEMRRRGHDVTVVGPKQFATRLALDDIGHVATARVAPSVDEVRDLCEQMRPDLLVVDGMMGDVLAAAPSFEGARSTAALVHTMWQPVADGEWDNVSLFCGLERINELRQQQGQRAVASGIDLLRDVDHVLAAMPAPLDRWPSTAWRNARYLGPLLEDRGPDDGWTPPAGYGPLVVVTLGTTPMDEEPVLERVIAAAGEIKGARFLVTVGDHVDTSGFETASNTALCGYIRHAAVLPHASLVVSHAGLGTIIAAATHGLPMLCVPLGRDQPANARRVVDLGLGESVAPDALAGELVVAIERTLAEATYRSAAIAMAGEIISRHPSPFDDFEALL